MTPLPVEHPRELETSAEQREVLGVDDVRIGQSMPGVRCGLERASGWSWELGLEDVVARCDCCGRANDRSGDGERGRRRAGLAPGESQVEVEGVAGWRASGRDGERREREAEVVQNGGCDIGFGDEGKDGERLGAARACGDVWAPDPA
jgi:hypothetical protein